jgi:hypothetical protein
MHFLSRLAQLSFPVLVALYGCIGTIDPVLVVRGSIHTDGGQTEGACDLILYDYGHGRAVATDPVVPFNDFVVGFDIPDAGRWFQIRAQCPGIETGFRSEMFDIETGVDIDLGVITLRQE